jgi:hypothetical protein
MAKTKKKVKSNRAKKYDDKLAVNCSFLDIMKASAKDANKKSAKKS